MQKQKSNIFDGDKGRLLLQISKTFHGDDRFKMDDRFKDDVEISKLPQKFKQIAEKQIIDRVTAKIKPIKKKPLPLIINRFQPGTQTAEKLVRKAQGQRNLMEALKNKQIRKSNKVSLQRGLNKVKLAERILRKNQKQPIQYEISVKGNRKDAFKASNFKLFD